MKIYRPAQDDYILTIYYQGNKYKLRLKLYHSDRQHSWYHLFAKSRVFDLKYNNRDKILTEELQHGQSPSPEEFLALIEKELQSMGE